MPFLYDSYETAGKVIFGEVGAQLDQQLEDTLNMHAFGWTWNNFRNMITKTPITSLDDCKGYKLRSPGTDLYLEHLQHPRHEPHRRSLERGLHRNAVRPC